MQGSPKSGFNLRHCVALFLIPGPIDEHGGRMAFHAPWFLVGGGAPSGFGVVYGARLKLNAA